MAGKPRPASAHPGQKRPRDRIIFWVDESKRTPLLINQVPAKSRRTHLSTEVKNTYNTHKACRKGHVPLRQIKSDQTEELDSIRRELSKIKAQVDSLLESLESMEQETGQHVGQEQRTVKGTGVLEVRTSQNTESRIQGPEGLPRSRQLRTIQGAKNPTSD